MTDKNSFVFYAKDLETKSFYDEKAKKTRYFIKGHIDSEDLDLVNDIVSQDCMADISSQFKSRKVKLDFDHETLRKSQGETELDAQLNLTKIPLGVAISETLDAKGNEVEFELNTNWKKFNSKGDVVMTFDQVWENVKSGFYDAFSIAYVPVATTHKWVDDVKARILDKINLINVALTGNPINPAATMTSVMAKSLEWLKSQEDEGKNMDEKSDSLISEIKSLKAEVADLKSIVGAKSMKKKNTDYDSDDQDRKPKEESDMEEEKKKKKPSGKGDTMEDETKEKKSQDEETQNEQKEEKSIDAKAFADLKSQVADLKSSIEEINKVLEKAIPAGKGAENKSEKADQDNAAAEAKSIGASTLDLI